MKTHNSYDGLIIFTDGYMDQPQIDFRLKAQILWILHDEVLFNKHKEWMKKYGRCCWMKW